MHHSTENPNLTPEPIDQSEIDRREKAYIKVVGKLPPDSRGVVSLLEGWMSEEDYYNKYKFHIGRRRALQRALGDIGLDNNGVRTVMNYFNLPYEAPKIRRR